jgi:hypothetical protein
MSKPKKLRLPQARKEGILIKELSHETLVYDLERHKAHCLNPTAAAIWKLCDGRRSAVEIASVMAEESRLPVDEPVVWYGVGQLAKAALMEFPRQRLDVRAGISRRDALGRIGIATAIAVPLVTSIVAPTARAAVSCTVACPGGDPTPCINFGPPCSGSCTNNLCDSL